MTTSIQFLGSFLYFRKYLNWNLYVNKTSGYNISDIFNVFK